MNPQKQPKSKHGLAHHSNGSDLRKVNNICKDLIWHHLMTIHMLQISPAQDAAIFMEPSSWKKEKKAHLEIGLA